jgi:predicted CXXCH cytochrome family protein
VIAWLVLLALFSGGLRSAAAQGWPNGTRIIDTPHNLLRPANNPGMEGRIASYGEVCVYCHAPHGGSRIAPLFNHPRPTPVYEMYPEGKMLRDPSPNDVSRACLSCHDGTIRLDGIVNPPNTHAGGMGTPEGTMDRCENCHSGGSPKGGIDWEGVWIRPSELDKMHPISVLYDDTRDPANFKPAAEVQAAGLKLPNGRVECVSCHEPHTNQYRPFLRISNSGNTLCLSCHKSMPAESTAHAW